MPLPGKDKRIINNKAFFFFNIFIYKKLKIFFTNKTFFALFLLAFSTPKYLSKIII